ncbi:MAG: YqaA family protein [Anaerolineaceae bacterium]
MEKKNPRQIIISVLILLVLLFFSVYLYINRQEIQHFAHYGYPGIFLISLLSNSTIIFPLPGVLVTSAMGAVFDPFWVAVTAGLGATLGEISGYLAGMAGKFVLEKKDWYDRILQAMQKYGVWMILVLAIIPNPFFDLAGIAAGVLRIPLWKFLLFCGIGKILKMLVFSYSGFSLSQFIAR